MNDEKDLIEGLIKGDETAYKHLYNLYYSELCIYLNTFCGSMDVSKDLAQHTFIKIWKKRNLLVINHSLKKYIFKIGYHLFIDLQRQKTKDFQLLEQLKHEAIDEILDFDDDYLEKKISIVIHEVNKLPNQCKKVFLLGKKEGLKYKEISEELNISIKTVERHMTKALKKLRNSFKENKTSVFMIIVFCIPNLFLKKR